MEGDTSREQLQQVINDVAAFEKFQVSGGDMPLRVTIETRAVSPFDPWLLNVGDEPAQAAVRAHVFQQPDNTARPDHAPQLAKRWHL